MAGAANNLRNKTDSSMAELTGSVSGEVGREGTWLEGMSERE
jgi:hypothetical protein